MAGNPNALVWDGAPGHYEVYYLSATDRASGCGLWIRYTMVAPEAARGEATCSLWLMAMDPERGAVLGPSRSCPLAELWPTTTPSPWRAGAATLAAAGGPGASRSMA